MQIKQVFRAYDQKDGTNHGLFKYCPFCGTHLTLNEKGGKQRPECSNCDFVQFQNPSPGVVVVIEKDGDVLLGKRSGGYGKGKWGLPQGYIEFEEDFLTAAVREVKEETGLDVEIKSVLNVASNLLSPGIHTLAVILLAEIRNGEPIAGDDLETLKWFPLAGPLPDMAFEADGQVIRHIYGAVDLVGLPVDPTYAGSHLGNTPR